MINKLRLFISLFFLLTLGLVGLVVLMIFTRAEPVIDEDLLSPTAPVFLSDEQLTAIWLTQTQLAIYDLESTRLWQRRTQMAAQATSTASTIPTYTPTPSDYASCGWMWATEPNPALSAATQSQMATMPEITEVRAESFGENCLDSDGSIRYFAAKQTDFRIFAEVDVPAENMPMMQTVPPHNLIAAQEALTPLTLNILNILAQYPPVRTPGPMPGVITIELMNPSLPGGVGYWLYADYGQAMAALGQGLTGPALFDALGGLRPRIQIVPT